MARHFLNLLLVFVFIEVINSGVLDKKKTEFKDSLKKDDRAKAEELADLFEGDIDMDKNMKRALIGGKISLRDAILDPVYQWPGGKLYFKFHERLSYYARHQIYRAMGHIVKHTCIRFKKYSGHPLQNHVIFFKGNGCYSRIGRTQRGFSQKISIDRGCTHLGTIVHEIMHALGFFHEQSRPDRDDYIKILWENISKSTLLIIGILVMLKQRYNHIIKRGYPRYRKAKKNLPEFELQPCLTQGSSHLLAFDNPYYDVLAAMGIDDDIEEEYSNPLYDDVSMYSDSYTSSTDDSCNKDLAHMVVT